jgi:F-type H+-transporting ATPase subunit epsilon
MSGFILKIISPDKTLFDGECDSLVFNASDGKYGIMRGHSPVTAAVTAGKIKILSEGKEIILETGSGILHFENNSALIVTE